MFSTLFTPAGSVAVSKPRTTIQYRTTGLLPEPLFFFLLHIIFTPTAYRSDIRSTYIYIFVCVVNPRSVETVPMARHKNFPSYGTEGRKLVLFHSPVARNAERVRVRSDEETTVRMRSGVRPSWTAFFTLP